MDKKKETKRAVKFLISGLVAAGIQMGAFAIFQEFVFHDSNEPYGWSYLISVGFSILWTFIFNRAFTFKSHNNIFIAGLKVIAYYLVATPLVIWGGSVLVDVGLNEYLTCGLSMIVNYIPKYFYYRFVVFGGSLDNNSYYRWRERQKQTKLDKKNANLVQQAVENPPQIDTEETND